MNIKPVSTQYIKDLTSRGSSMWGVCEKISLLSRPKQKIIAYCYPFILLFDDQLNLEWKMRVKKHVNSLKVYGEKGSHKRILVGSGENSEHGYIEIVSKEGDILWRERVPGPVRDTCAVDIDKDKKKEIAAGSHNSVYVFEKDGGIRWKYEHKITAPDIERDITCLYGMDTDSDGHAEIIAGIGPSYGKLEILKEEKSFFGSKGSLSAEIFTDGSPEYISKIKSGTFLAYCAYYEGIEYMTGKLFIFDSHSLKNNDWKNVYRFDGLIPSGAHITVSDIDGDRHKEIVFTTDKGGIHVLDESGILKWKRENDFHGDFPCISFCGDLNNDGLKEIIVGRRKTHVTEFFVFSHKNDLIDKFDIYENIHSLQVGDVDNDGTPEMVLGGDDTLQLFKVLYSSETVMYDDDTRIYR